MYQLGQTALAKECIRTDSLSNVTPIEEAGSPVKIIDRTPGHALSNNGLCLHAAAQYVLRFLVLAVNSKFYDLRSVRMCSCLSKVLPKHTYTLYILAACQLSCK